MRAFPLIVAAVLCGCTGSSSEAAAPAAVAGDAVVSQSATAIQAPAPVPAELPDVLARVNGDAIGKADMERAVQTLERANGPLPREQRDRILRGVLDQLIGHQLLVQEVHTRNVSVPESAVDARIAQIRAQFPSEAEFEQLLAARKLTIDQVKSDARQDMAIGKLIDDEIAPRVVVKPEEVADFYAKNADQFKQGDAVRASHILIGVPKGADAAGRAEARTKAEQVLEQVKAGNDFAALAKQYSSDPGSAANGGDLGFFQQGEMVGPFNDAAFSLAPGATSELVETEFGFHIIRVVEKKPGRTISLEEIQPKVREYLEQMKRQEETDAFVDSLRAKGKIEVLI